MTLSEIADYVCTKVGDIDDFSVSACKKFARARWKEIWDSAPWRDSQSLVSVTQQGVRTAFVPWPIEKVMKIRMNTTSAGTKLWPFEQGTVFDYDPTLFDTTGTPIGFLQIQPLALPNTYALGSGVSVSVSVATPALSVNYPATGNLDLNSSATISGLDNAGNMISETMSLGILNPSDQNSVGSVSQNAFTQVFTITKASTVNRMVAAFPGLVAYTNYLQPSQTTANPFQQIQLVSESNATSLPLLILGKRFCPELLTDTDQATLSGADNVLLDLTQADMLERQRQYAKAQAKISEANQKLQIMLDLEKNQSASDIRLIPKDIHGTWVGTGDLFGRGKEDW